MDIHMPKRINDTKLRRQQILKSARKVFLEKGVQGATIDDIAREEGVVRGTILYHYKSKELLLEAVLEEDSRKWEPMVEALVERHEVPVEERIDKIFALCEDCFVSEKVQIRQLTGKESGADGDIRPQQRDNKEFAKIRFFLDQMRLKNYYQQTEGLAAILEEGAARGEITLDNPRMRAASIMFAVFGMTGADISSEELKIQLRSLKKQLFAACGKNKAS